MLQRIDQLHHSDTTFPSFSALLFGISELPTIVRLGNWTPFAGGTGVTPEPTLGWFILSDRHI